VDRAEDQVEDQAEDLAEVLIPETILEMTEETMKKFLNSKRTTRRWMPESLLRNDDHFGSLSELLEPFSLLSWPPLELYTFMEEIDDNNTRDSLNKMPKDFKVLNMESSSLLSLLLQ